uniref:Uncharacterized protein n=1 Tax=Triticum urartu TaxID=4572 RepID=A0A8R7VEV6_TRIUA
PSSATQATTLNLKRGEEEEEERSNGVRAPLQQLQQQQGEEASAQERPAQAADRKDPRQPRGAGRQDRLQLQKMILSQGKQHFLDQSKEYRRAWCFDVYRDCVG